MIMPLILSTKYLNVYLEMPNKSRSSVISIILDLLFILYVPLSDKSKNVEQNVSFVNV